MKSFKSGFIIGLLFQLAIGPIFFFIANLTIQKGRIDGMVGVGASTIVDRFYIILVTFGITKIFESKKIKKILEIIGSIMLLILGTVIINGALTSINEINVHEFGNLFSNFITVLIVAISSPITFLLFTTVFSTKAIEYKHNKKQLHLFAYGAAIATPLFLVASVFLFSLIKKNIPNQLIQIFSIIIGTILLVYGIIGLIKVIKKYRSIKFGFREKSI